MKRLALVVAVGGGIFLVSYSLTRFAASEPHEEQPRALAATAPQAEHAMAAGLELPMDAPPPVPVELDEPIGAAAREPLRVCGPKVLATTRASRINLAVSFELRHQGAAQIHLADVQFQQSDVPVPADTQQCLEEQFEGLVVDISEEPDPSSLNRRFAYLFCFRVE